MIDLKMMTLFFFLMTGCLSDFHHEAKLYFTDYCTYFDYPS